MVQPQLQGVWGGWLKVSHPQNSFIHSFIHRAPPGSCLDPGSRITSYRLGKRGNLGTDGEVSTDPRSDLWAIFSLPSSLYSGHFTSERREWKTAISLSVVSLPFYLIKTWAFYKKLCGPRLRHMGHVEDALYSCLSKVWFVSHNSGGESRQTDCCFY